MLGVRTKLRDALQGQFATVIPEVLGQIGHHSFSWPFSEAPTRRLPLWTGTFGTCSGSSTYSKPVGNAIFPTKDMLNGKEGSVGINLLFNAVTLGAANLVGSPKMHTLQHGYEVLHVNYGFYFMPCLNRCKSQHCGSMTHRYLSLYHPQNFHCCGRESKESGKQSPGEKGPSRSTEGDVCAFHVSKRHSTEREMPCRKRRHS